MIEELLYVTKPVHTARLRDAQDRERADKNAETLLSWYTTTYGIEVGTFLHREHMNNLEPI